MANYYGMTRTNYFHVKDGKVREATGRITYFFDDTGEEVNLNDDY